MSMPHAKQTQPVCLYFLLEFIFNSRILHSSFFLEAYVESLRLLLIACLVTSLLFRDILLYSYFLCLLRRSIRMRSGAPLFSSCKSRDLKFPVMK